MSDIFKMQQGGIFAKVKGVKRNFYPAKEATQSQDIELYKSPGLR